VAEETEIDFTLSIIYAITKTNFKPQLEGVLRRNAPEVEVILLI
jgi:hypothetical protein